MMRSFWRCALERSSRLVQSARRYHVVSSAAISGTFRNYRLLDEWCAFTSSPGVFVARHPDVLDKYSPSALTKPCFPFACAERPGSKLYRCDIATSIARTNENQHDVSREQSPALRSPRHAQRAALSAQCAAKKIAEAARADPSLFEQGCAGTAGSSGG
jgi:hypothetical protein